MSYQLAIPIQLGSSKTGLTLSGQLIDSSNNNVATVVTFYERGNGVYTAILTVPDGHVGTFEVTATGGIRVACAINPAETENADAKTSTRLASASYTAPDNAGIDSLESAVAARLDVAVSTRLASAAYSAPPSAATIADSVWDEALSGHGTAGSAGEALSTAGDPGDPLESLVPGSYASGTAGNALGRLGSAEITTVSPISPDGELLTIVRGDDYAAADGRALDWIDDSAAWPDLTGATIAFGARRVSEVITAEGSVIVATGANKQVRVELAAADTDGKAPGAWPFDVQATLANGRIVTLVRGAMTLVEDMTHE